MGSYCPQIAHTQVVVFSRSWSPFSALPAPAPPLPRLLLLPRAFTPRPLLGPSLISSSSSLYFGASAELLLFLLVTIFITFELFSCLNTDTVVLVVVSTDFELSWLSDSVLLLLLLAVLCLAPPMEILMLVTSRPADTMPRSPRPRPDTCPRPREFRCLEPGVATFIADPGVFTRTGL